VWKKWEEVRANNADRFAIDYYGDRPLNRYYRRVERVVAIRRSNEAPDAVFSFHSLDPTFFPVVSDDFLSAAALLFGDCS